MAATITVNKVKTFLRISHTALDTEVADEIDACLADLRLCGIRTPDEADPIILNAIKLYTKAHFLDDAAKATAFMARYNELKGSLTFATGYGGESGEY